jgi:hypothetical protein
MAMERFRLELYETDVASNYLQTFVKGESFSYLRRSVEQAITDDYLEFDLALEAVVALEVIAAIKGNSFEDFPLFEEMSEGELIEKFESKMSNYLMSLCEDALAILKRDEDSEPFEYFEEQGEIDEWLDLLDDLEERLF